MMDEKILNELNQEAPSEFANTMLKKCRGLVSLSHQSMSRYYDSWDKADDTYRGIRAPDAEDKKADKRKEPIKFVVPMTYSQIMTFVSFCYHLFTQNDTFFEIEGYGMSDMRAALISESLLERDLNHSNFRGWVLYQILLDIGRYGVGVVKHSWVKETKRVKEMVQSEEMLPGATQPTITSELQVMDKVKFAGNSVFPVSPYRFFPDPRLPLVRFQEGEFCASDTEMSYVTLKQMEKDKLIAGVKHIQQMQAHFMDERRFAHEGSAAPDTIKNPISDSKDNYLITEVQVKLIPNEVMFTDGSPMGPEDYPVTYLVWYANDMRIIRMEMLDYPHGCFTYDVCQFSQDQMHHLNSSISDILEMLQDTISWYLNAHITSVRKNIDNKFIVDPTGINIKDFSERSPIITLKPGAARSGVDRWFKQLAISDVTQNHMKDMGVLGDIAKETTGITENLLGQFASGRRSAAEAHNVAAGAVSKIKMTATLIWWSLFKPLGEKMLDNLREGTDPETLIKVIGADDLVDADGMPLTDLQGLIKVNPSDLIGDFEFKVFDGTLPSEKGYLSSTIQDILTAIIGNPIAAGILGYDPRALMDFMLRLRGIKGSDRMKFPKPIRDAMFQRAMGALIGPIAPTGGTPNGQPETTTGQPTGTSGMSNLIQG